MDIEFGTRVVVRAAVEMRYDQEDWMLPGKPTQEQLAGYWIRICGPETGLGEVSECKALYRHEFGKSISGMVIGQCKRATGRYWHTKRSTFWPYDDQDDERGLSDRKYVWFYEIGTSLDMHDRFFALPEDIEVVGEQHV